MHKSVISLFELNRSKVTNQDILDFTPRDPGYQDYIKVWTQILETGEVPLKSHFDLSEVIGLTGYVDPNEEAAPERFLNYRRFTSAVAIVLLHNGNHSESVRPPNYLARDLIVDSKEQGADYLQLLFEVFEQTKKLLKTQEEEIEFPFYTFGMLILAQKLEDWQKAEQVAIQLIDDESAARNSDKYDYLVQNSDFLLGLTIYDQFHQDWKRLAGELKNPNNHENTQLVIESL